MKKSEYIVWKCETREDIKRAHPEWNKEQVEKYLSAVEAALEEKLGPLLDH